MLPLRSNLRIPLSWTNFYSSNYSYALRYDGTIKMPVKVYLNGYAYQDVYFSMWSRKRSILVIVPLLHYISTAASNTATNDSLHRPLGLDELVVNARIQVVSDKIHSMSLLVTLRVTIHGHGHFHLFYRHRASSFATLATNGDLD